MENNLGQSGGGDRESSINEQGQINSNPMMQSQEVQSQEVVQQIPNNEVAGNFQSESHNPAMHFFLYLTSFFSLCFFSTGAGTILFQLINNNFSDPLSSRYDYYSYFSQYAVKYGIASLIIAAPIYFAVMYFIAKYLHDGKIQEYSKVRKWLTYIVLFIAAAIIIGDLITLVFNLLGGDIVARFILKVLVVLAIAGSIFTYYLMDMRKKDMIGIKYLSNKLFGWISGILTIIIVLSAFTIVDSPFASRDRKIDEMTISDIESVDSRILNYYRDNSVLPESLADLDRPSYSRRRDSADSVKYKKIDSMNYQLCAEFLRSSDDYKSGQRDLYYSEEWEYEKGMHCFDKDVDGIKNKNSIRGGAIYENQQNINQESAQMMAQKANIKSNAASAATIAYLCKDESGNVLSGNGGDPICSSSEIAAEWPSMNICGPEKSDTKWIVKNGDTASWDITLSCKNFSYCDGPNNLLCNNEGVCTGSGTCN